MKHNLRNTIVAAGTLLSLLPPSASAQTGTAPRRSAGTPLVKAETVTTPLLPGQMSPDANGLMFVNRGSGKMESMMKANDDNLIAKYSVPAEGMEGSQGIPDPAATNQEPGIPAEIIIPEPELNISPKEWPELEIPMEDVPARDPAIPPNPEPSLQKEIPADNINDLEGLSLKDMALPEQTESIPEMETLEIPELEEPEKPKGMMSAALEKILASQPDENPDKALQEESPPAKPKEKPKGKSDIEFSGLK